MSNNEGRVVTESDDVPLSWNAFIIGTLNASSHLSLMTFERGKEGQSGGGPSWGSLGKFITIQSPGTAEMSEVVVEGGGSC